MACLADSAPTGSATWPRPSSTQGLRLAATNAQANATQCRGGNCRQQTLPAASLHQAHHRHQPAHNTTFVPSKRTCLRAAQCHNGIKRGPDLAVGNRVRPTRPDLIRQVGDPRCRSNAAASRSPSEDTLAALTIAVPSPTVPSVCRSVPRPTA